VEFLIVAVVIFMVVLGIFGAVFKGAA